MTTLYELERQLGQATPLNIISKTNMTILPKESTLGEVNSHPNPVSSISDLTPSHIRWHIKQASEKVQVGHSECEHPGGEGLRSAGSTIS